MRPYTGISDGIGKRRPGLEAFAGAVEYLTQSMIWNNGTYGIRNTKGRSTLSVHATGRAVDLSRRPVGKSTAYGLKPKTGCPRTSLDGFVAFLLANADTFGIECVVDYAGHKDYPHGRSWRCDRGTWKAAKVGAIVNGGASWADWVHVELDPAHADSVEWVDDFCRKLCAPFATKPKPRTKAKP